jgi:hypothetical protein
MANWNARVLINGIPVALPADTPAEVFGEILLQRRGG